MNILFITPRFPYPFDRGDKIRPFYFAKTLSKKYNIYLASFLDKKDKAKIDDTLLKIFKEIEILPLHEIYSYSNMLWGLFSLRPLQVSYFQSREMEGMIKKIIRKKKIDVIYAFHIRITPYVKDIKSCYKILDYTDSVSLFIDRVRKKSNFFLKPVLFYEWLTVKRYETYISKYFDEYWFISEVDKNAVKGLDRAKTFIVPNGIDFQYFSHNDQIKKENALIFVGYMSVESVKAILYFYKKIWPEIKKEISDVKFYIVGANPPANIKKLAEIDKDIIVTGFVEDLRDYYAKASILVAPMVVVVGVQNKILEAMAMGLPVVTTSFGNEGINARHGEEIFIADKPEEFGKYVIDLLKNKKLREQIGKNARKFVIKNFSWEKVNERIEQICKKLNDKKTRYS
ncbi:MAG: hypothetical protein DRI61_16685 [Chloroflexi bacterium]|nr:MAG: hypothetical protein DRI61_16685 [Chloroflexota bacterium]